MAIKYENVVPWGRNYEEYIEMFALTEEDMNKRIIGCGDGPASFNAQATERGYRVVSIDPVYRFTKEQIEKRVEETYDIVIEQTSQNREKFVWKNFKDVEELGKKRMEAMRKFLSDYEIGKKEKRYIAGEFPKIDIESSSFEIALCSHFLFLYSDNLTFEFHIESIEEMLRVANEARIFPILDNNAEVSKHYEKVKENFRNRGFSVEEIKVEYEFQKNGNKMLKIKR